MPSVLKSCGDVVRRQFGHSGHSWTHMTCAGSPSYVKINKDDGNHCQTTYFIPVNQSEALYGREIGKWTSTSRALSSSRSGGIVNKISHPCFIHLSCNPHRHWSLPRHNTGSSNPRARCSGWTSLRRWKACIKLSVDGSSVGSNNGSCGNR